ncbi:MAG: response regulator transcription factor [Bacteroidales bacterium]|nr:response regulator transcription factor [Bacteroidales bacterium]MBN2762142.1 response regulator transcription factor [Bacteroidales bacterium]
MKKLKILIVDDNPHFINALKYMISDFFEDRIENIDEAHDGAECLELLKKKVCDLVFMDISMPNMNGIDATREATRMFRNLIIIAVSFHSEMNYVVQMIEAGARSYLIKDEINKESLEKVLSIEYTF